MKICAQSTNKKPLMKNTKQIVFEAIGLTTISLGVALSLDDALAQQQADLPDNVILLDESLEEATVTHHLTGLNNQTTQHEIIIPNDDSIKLIDSSSLIDTKELSLENIQKDLDQLNKEVDQIMKTQQRTDQNDYSLAPEEEPVMRQTPMNIAKLPQYNEKTTGDLSTNDIYNSSHEDTSEDSSIFSSPYTYMALAAVAGGGLALAMSSSSTDGLSPIANNNNDILDDIISNYDTGLPIKSAGDNLFTDSRTDQPPPQLKVFTSVIADTTPQQAPDFTLTDVLGDQYSLYESFLDQGKVVVLDFYAAWCPHCQSLRDSGLLSSLAEEYGDDVVVLTIEAASNSTHDDLIEFFGGNLDGHSELIFEETSLNSLFGLKYFPTLFAISSSGEMIDFGSVRNQFASHHTLYQELIAYEYAYGTKEIATDENNADTNILDLIAEDNNSVEDEEEAACDITEEAEGCGVPTVSGEWENFPTECGEGILYEGIKTVADFTLTDISGKTFTLTEMQAQGTYVVINFFSAGCSHCTEGREEDTALNQILENHDDVVIFHIEMDTKTPLGQLKFGFDGYDWSQLQNGVNEYVFNLTNDEISTNMSSYITIEELETCGYPGLYFINSDFEMINIDREEVSGDELYQLLTTHIGPLSNTSPVDDIDNANCEDDAGCTIPDEKDDGNQVSPNTDFDLADRSASIIGNVLPNIPMTDYNENIINIYDLTGNKLIIWNLFVEFGDEDQANVSFFENLSAQYQTEYVKVVSTMVADENDFSIDQDDLQNWRIGLATDKTLGIEVPYDESFTAQNPVTHLTTKVDYTEENWFPLLSHLLDPAKKGMGDIPMTAIIDGESFVVLDLTTDLTNLESKIQTYLTSATWERTVEQPDNPPPADNNERSADVILAFDNLTENSIDLLYDAQVPVQAYQFTLKLAGQIDSITTDGFDMVQFNEQQSGSGEYIVLGLSLSGASLPTGTHTLASITYTSEQALTVDDFVVTEHIILSNQQEVSSVVSVTTIENTPPSADSQEAAVETDPQESAVETDSQEAAVETDPPPEQDNTAPSTNNDENSTDVVLAFDNLTENSIDLLYDAQVPVQAYQFTLKLAGQIDSITTDGFDLVQFNEQQSGSGEYIVLGLSLSGASLPTGTHTLASITYTSEQALTVDDFVVTEHIILSNQQEVSSVVSVTTIENTPPSADSQEAAIETDPPTEKDNTAPSTNNNENSTDVVLAFDNLTENSIDLLYDAQVPVQAYQFTLTLDGEIDSITTDGFDLVQFNEQQSGSGEYIVLGLSLSGASLPTGTHTLASITYTSEQALTVDDFVVTEHIILSNQQEVSSVVSITAIDDTLTDELAINLTVNQTTDQEMIVLLDAMITPEDIAPVSNYLATLCEQGKACFIMLGDSSTTLSSEGSEFSIRGEDGTTLLSSDNTDWTSNQSINGTHAILTLDEIPTSATSFNFNLTDSVGNGWSSTSSGSGEMASGIWFQHPNGDTQLLHVFNQGFEQNLEITLHPEEDDSIF